MKEKILIIDDDQAITESMQAFLENEGYAVLILEEAAQAMTLVEHEQPDVVLLDVFLSGYDGRKIAKQIKTTEQTKHIPIIIMSAHPKARYTVKQCMANDYLEKPFNGEVLLEKIEKNIQQRFSFFKLFS